MSVFLYVRRMPYATIRVTISERRAEGARSDGSRCQKQYKKSIRSPRIELCVAATWAVLARHSSRGGRRSGDRSSNRRHCSNPANENDAIIFFESSLFLTSQCSHISYSFHPPTISKMENTCFKNVMKNEKKQRQQTTSSRPD